MTESDTFIHQTAIVEPGAKIGPKTRVWANSHILPGAVIGEDCNICDHVFIENEVRVGDRVTVKSGVQLWDGVTLEDDVFVGPNATFTNDPFPRSKQYPDQFEKTVVKHGASIGANATILPGLSIGAGAMIGAGAVVTRDVPPRAVVLGNPATIVGYTDTSVRSMPKTMEAGAVPDSSVRGVKLIALNHVPDMRGDLCAMEFSPSLPFQPRRAFLVYSVPNTRVRGEHAHKKCEQFLLCVSGSVAVIADDGESREEYVLSSPEVGLYMPAGVWGTQYKYSPDAVLLVLASLEYDPEDYIREYDEFLQWITR